MALLLLLLLLLLLQLPLLIWTLSVRPNTNQVRKWWRRRWGEGCCAEHARNACWELRRIEQHLSNARVLWQWWFAWTNCLSNYNSMMPRSSSVQSFYIHSHIYILPCFVYSFCKCIMYCLFIHTYFFLNNETWGLIHICIAFDALLVGSLAPQHPPRLRYRTHATGIDSVRNQAWTAAGGLWIGEL